MSAGADGASAHPPAGCLQLTSGTLARRAGPPDAARGG